MKEIWSGKSGFINCCLSNLSCQASTGQQFYTSGWIMLVIFFPLSRLVLLYKKCEFTSELSHISCINMVFCNGHFKLIRAGGRYLPVLENRQQLSYNWVVVPWKYDLSVTICFKEKWVLRILRKMESRIHHSATVCAYAPLPWKLRCVVSWHPSQSYRLKKVQKGITKDNKRHSSFTGQHLYQQSLREIKQFSSWKQRQP